MYMCYMWETTYTCTCTCKWPKLNGTQVAVLKRVSGSNGFHRGTREVGREEVEGRARRTILSSSMYYVCVCVCGGGGGGGGVLIN